MFLLVYLSNDTATPSRELKKKKKVLLVRPLLIGLPYACLMGLSNTKENTPPLAAGCRFIQVRRAFSVLPPTLSRAAPSAARSGIRR